MGGGGENENDNENQEEVFEVEETCLSGLQAKANECLWYEKLQKCTSVQTLFSFVVPRIICIGEESSGKSSTLERIAEMSFFPTDRQLCTRMPIELRLRHKSAQEIKEHMGDESATSYVMMELIRGTSSKMPADAKEGPFSPSEVASKVKEWMLSIVATNNEGSGALGVSDDRLIIELYSTRNLDLDLIDLPGIVAGHTKGEADDIAEKTRYLTEQYVKEPHTLIVLVVFNRAERIRNSQAFELVQRYNKEKQTVGVLTMVDRCADNRKVEDPFWELKERLDGSSDDLPELGMGYVALKNRDTMLADGVSVSLQAANTEELHWFQTYIPEETIQARSCLGIDSLLSKLLSLLGTYTEETWSMSENIRLNHQHDRVCDELQTLSEVYTGNLKLLLAKISSTIYPIDGEMATYSLINDGVIKLVEKIRPPPGSGPPGAGPPSGKREERKWFASSSGIQMNCASEPNEFYREKALLVHAVDGVVQKSLQDFIHTPVESILDTLFASNQLPLLLNRFYRLRGGIEQICRQWATSISESILNKFRVWFSFDEIFTHQGQRLSLQGAPLSYCSCLLTPSKTYPGNVGHEMRNSAKNSVLMSRIVDLLMTELAINPLQAIFRDIVTLEKDLQWWWESRSSAFSGRNDALDDDTDDLEEKEEKAESQSPLCKEKPSFTDRRLRLQQEKLALDVMIKTLHEVFPSFSRTPCVGSPVFASFVQFKEKSPSGGGGGGGAGRFQFGGGGGGDGFSSAGFSSPGPTGSAGGGFSSGSILGKKVGGGSGGGGRFQVGGGGFSIARGRPSKECYKKVA